MSLSLTAMRQSEARGAGARIAAYFAFGQHGSNFQREVMVGVTTFFIFYPYR